IFPRMRSVKATFASLVGCDPDELAITVNVSLALSAVLSCLDFSKRHKVVLSELDFPTDGHVALAYRKLGARPVFVKSPDGLTFLYARRDLLPSLEPLLTGWFGTREPFSFDLQHLDYHPTARRLEHGTPAAPVAFIAQGGLDVITEVGPANTRERQQDLIDYVIARADEAGLPVRSPRDRQRRGGMVNIGVGQDAEKVCHSLLDRNVCTDFRGDGIRVSPHFFNVEADVDRLFEG